MIRFIWQNWWRRKERLILLIVGALIISIGLTYLVGISDANKGTIVDELQQRWSSSYDIVVRPAGSRSVTEEKGLLDPNYLSGLDGGISRAQYEQIKTIRDVEVAAPIAMISPVLYTTKLTQLDLPEGIYRMTTEEVSNDGISKESTAASHYFAVGNYDMIVKKFQEQGPDYFLRTPFGYPDHHLITSREMLLAGIDPEQEAKLVGLDQAIVDNGPGRYFTGEDVSMNEVLDEETDLNMSHIPVIINNQSFTDIAINYTIERLDLPFDGEVASETLKMLEDNGGQTYLDTLEAVDQQNYTYTDQEIYSRMVNSISGSDTGTGEPFLEDYLYDRFAHLSSRPSPLQYEDVLSPFSERWPYAYELQTFEIPDFPQDKSFRVYNSYGFSNGGGYPRVQPEWIGFYDANQLAISKDPTNELPMETYRPASAELVVDASDNPINPPKVLKPAGFAMDFLSTPPSMLTTIEAAERIMGDKPISAIRIRVAGVADLSDDSQQIVEKVAREIEEQTGLLTDITLGSSPQPTLVHVPAINDTEELGWFQQPWVSIGSSITLFREAKIGFSGLIISTMAVAVIYVWASSLVSLLARRKEFAVLLAVGWRPTQLSKLLFMESAILGAFVALISWMMLGFVSITEGATVLPIRFLLTGLFGFVVYVLGAVIPGLLVRQISPYEAMQTGEISKASGRMVRTRGLLSMAFNHFTGKWKRSLLSIVAIALPTSLLALFLYVTVRLQGIMYTTWLGQYVALEVGPVHYTAMAVALNIAILTTAEIMWQNIAERQGEIALLKAVGWKDRHVRLLILIEGMFSGLFAAIIGLALAFGIMWGLYRQMPVEELGFILATGFIPIIIGIIGTILPAERAVRMSPVRGVGGNYSNRKVVEKRLKWMIIVIFLVVVGVLVYTLL
ncbi:ABC transporter permease [Filibacter tadaridae]|uniref:Outer membrane-specific lipoprotein transporter subunit LolE n=1 Tax=Filibacter tadaridae TaxID=2483811 RepID=A0A3P5XCU6_9BACL|nr:ABC transporter permease [Filibacter tadaridae]VDC32516.1 outer membrane-specific lipoprotein transporter subunit LolE [Filibacter tadaridae]